MSYPRRVVLVLGDKAHQRVIMAIIQRGAEGRITPVEIQVLNATHGSRVWREFRQYLREIKEGRQPVPDVLVVVIDGNCKTAAQVRRDIQEEVKKRGLEIPHLVCAVPDPHIERWYLEDQQALKSILPGAEPEKLPYKCERDQYKRALKNAIRAAGVEPSLGGAEYGDEVAKVLDPNRLDRSFRDFWKELLRAL
ncbi:MAG: DUF4276 family protein [Armatimonadota bacterium]